MKYATIVITILIITAVLIPGPNLPNVSIGSFDKVIHIGMFCVWAIAVRYDFNPRPFNFSIIFLAGMAFSLFTEILQLLVEGRSFDFYDMVADGIGLMTGLLLSGKILKILGK